MSLAPCLLISNKTCSLCCLRRLVSNCLGSGLYDDPCSCNPQPDSFRGARHDRYSVVKNTLLHFDCFFMQPFSGKGAMGNHRY